MQTATAHKKEDTVSRLVNPGEHLVGEVIGDEDGPSLIVVGSIHGNEPSGVTAMNRVVKKLEKLKNLEAEIKGRIYLIAGNTRALGKNVRYLDADLNRQWTDELVNRNRGGKDNSTKGNEEIEQGEILEILDRVLLSAKSEVFSLDLHSTSSKSTPFAMIGDTLRNRGFAQNFPATILLGIEEQLDGTILEYLNNLGSVTLGFEAGQHTDQTAVDNQESLIWLAAAYSGIISKSSIDLAKYVRILSKATGHSRLIEIRHRHRIVETDNFEMLPGFKNFQSVTKNDHLASDSKGDVLAKETGIILMPLYQKQGEDGFFLGREISRFWLKLSWVLRKLQAGKLMSLLPGVRKAPEDENTFIVNTSIARVFPLQIFHLLGFRKQRWHGDKLVVTRRRHDLISPFVKTPE